MPDPEAIVAVVDDDPSMLGSIDCLLSAHGFAIETFVSAEDFLRRTTSNRLSCLILDINLGGMSGLELARVIANRNLRIPTIFITASDSKATCDQAFDIGCVAYLRKPFPGRLLVDAIAKATLVGNG
jgi:FixJ family two-component response regulator